MKINSGFLNGTKGIFNDKKNNNNRKKRKMGKILLDRVVGMFKGDELEVKPIQYQRVTKNKSSYKNKDIKYKNNKKKKIKKGTSRVQIPSESVDAYSSEEDDNKSVSGLPGLQERNRLDSESENDENNNNNTSDIVDDGFDSDDDLDNESYDRYYKIPHALRSKSNTDEWVDNDDYNEDDYDGDSDTSSSGDTPRSRPKDNTSPSATPRRRPSIESTKNGKPRGESSLGESPRTEPRMVQNEIKVDSDTSSSGDSPR